MKRSILAIFFSLTMLALAPFAMAAKVVDKGEAITQFTVPAYPTHEITVYRLDEIEAPNTSAGMDGFAGQVATWLYNWTKKNEVEASGNICKSEDGSRWGIVIVTIYAHAASPRTNACPEGMVMSGVDIHSHPQRHSYKVNPVDHLLLQPGLMSHSEIATFPDKFSPNDVERPGYLVGQISLHFQDGQGHERIVKPVYK